MPGKLTVAHQKFEERCSSCHDRSDRNRQTRLCLDCHKEIAADLGTGRGYHGRFPGIATSQCRACHSEHLGRSADIIKLSPGQFNHDRTDFPLQAAHANVPCSSCHSANQAFRKAAVECASCHQKQEPHDGKLGANCGSCHDATAWQHVSFDHDKTAYPLRDKHREVPCIACHLANKYKSTPKECVSCHAPDDVHRGERGTNCGSCHATTGWKTARFDHEKETGFALQGVHARVDCQDCHSTGNLKDKLPRECAGCHRGEDSHRGRLGKDCGQCHGSEQWQPARFDHAKDAHWQLSGKHQSVDCHTCHTAPIATQKLPTDCASCHHASDVHAGALGTRCDQCHTTSGWQATSFDHDLSSFPLLGLHVAVPCEQCHVTAKFKDVGQQCIDCHQRDDVHKGVLGKECSRCHSPNGWAVWQFDHAKETGFALSGAHAKLVCAGCHKQPADRVKLNPTCLACHEQDDVHLGQYGRQCQRCHSTASFKGARLQ